MTTSSASTIRTHSLRNRRFSSAQFFFLGKVPLNWNWTSFAPCSRATSAVASLLWLSTTKTSSAHASAGRQRRRFSASFLTGTITLTGTDRAGRGRGVDGCDIVDLLGFGGCANRTLQDGLRGEALDDHF